MCIFSYVASSLTRWKLSRKFHSRDDGATNDARFDSGSVALLDAGDTRNGRVNSVDRGIDGFGDVDLPLRRIASDELPEACSLRPESQHWFVVSTGAVMAVALVDERALNACAARRQRTPCSQARRAGADQSSNPRSSAIINASCARSRASSSVNTNRRAMRTTSRYARWHASVVVMGRQCNGSVRSSSLQSRRLGRVPTASRHGTRKRYLATSLSSPKACSFRPKCR